MTGMICFLDFNPVTEELVWRIVKKRKDSEKGKERKVEKERIESLVFR